MNFTVLTYLSFLIFIVENTEAKLNVILHVWRSLLTVNNKD